MAARIEHLVTSGLFHLDGGAWEVDNNVWLVGDDDEVLVVDAPHDAAAILAAVDGRKVTAIACTHAHDDHVNVALALREATDAPILVHPADAPLWEMTHPGRAWDRDLADGEVLRVAGTDLNVLHTPGHAPGCCCFYAAELGTVFSGDTLFNGGPGATGRSFSDKPTILRSISSRLLTLPADTVVRTGHGDSTTIGAEAPGVEAELAAGQ